MVYLAGDNNLEAYGERDLMAMKSVGSTTDVNIVAEFDCMSDSITRRYYLTRNRPLTGDVVAELEDTNSGDPQVLLDFVRWALGEYPADRTALILWNHGTGWKDEDLYALGTELGLADDEMARSLIRNVGRRRLGRALFASSIKRVLRHPAAVRAILFDDTSRDFLDSQELKVVLDAIVADRGGERLDIVGFDACLMNMIEVAGQVDHAFDHMVGSQEIEPADGWPYDRLLAPLVAAPAMSAGAWSEQIVAAYGEEYRVKPAGFAVTQSALRLRQLPALVAAVDSLAEVLLVNLGHPGFVTGVLMGAMRGAHAFSDQDAVDLGDFGREIGEREGADAVGDAVRGLLQALSSFVTCSVSVAGGPTAASSAWPTLREGGTPAAGATGVSIYLPMLGPSSPAYGDLEFSKRSRWGTFVSSYLET
jgi:hypothetical protein